MAMAGAAVDELEQLAKAVESAGHRFGDIRAGLDGQVHGTRWTGSDGARFGHDWGTTHGPRLAAMGHALIDLAVLLRRQAQEQASASAINGGPGGGPVGVAAGIAGAALGGAVGLGRSLAGTIANIGEKVTLPWAVEDLTKVAARVMHDEKALRPTLRRDQPLA